MVIMIMFARYPTHQEVTVKLVEYTQELHKAIESLKQMRVSDASLWLSNFYYKKGRSRPNNYVKILQWTLADEQYKNADLHTQSRIARFYYFIDTDANSEANSVFVKRTAHGYKIFERKSSK
jgi:hypothetical protein